MELREIIKVTEMEKKSTLIKKTKMCFLSVINNHLKYTNKSLHTIFLENKQL